MESKNIEREFDIKLIASFVENKVLVVFNKNYTAILRSSSILFLEVGIIPQLGVE